MKRQRLIQAGYSARNAAQKKTKCPDCGKKVKVTGLAMDGHDVHGVLYRVVIF